MEFSLWFQYNNNPLIFRRRSRWENDQGDYKRTSQDV